MKKKQYEAKRQQLLNEVQALIDAGKAVQAEEKMQEITDLDEQWEAIARAEANLRAITGEPRAMQPNGIEAAFGETQNSGESEVVKAWNSEEYVNAWAKTMMGKPLTNEEDKAYKLVNEAYTHTTKNTGVVIPNTVAREIWELAGELYPYFNDVTQTHVDGVLSILQEDTSSDAKWYDEDTTTEDGKETLKEFKLNGCELSRAITITWKLKEMSIKDFIRYIQRKMAKKMGAGAGYGVTHGKGANAEDGKPEPMGTVTALLAEDGKPQVVEYTYGEAPTYENLTLARSKVKSGYGAGLKVYANTNTIWNKIATVVDKTGRPLFVPDPTSGGAYRVLGMPVEEDDSMEDGEILLSNAADGYHLNINKEMSMMTEDHVKTRKTDYCGYAIMDGNVLTTKAHVLLKEGTKPLKNQAAKETAVNTQAAKTSEKPVVE